MRPEHGGVSHSYTHAKAHTCVKEPQALSSLAWRQEIAVVSLSHSLTHTHTQTHTHTHCRWVLCWWGPNLTQDVRLCMYSPYLHCYCSPEAAVWVWHLPGKDEGEGEGTGGLTEQTGRWRGWDNSSPFTFSENAFMISLRINLHLCFSHFVF